MSTTTLLPTSVLTTTLQTIAKNVTSGNSNINTTVTPTISVLNTTLPTFNFTLSNWNQTTPTPYTFNYPFWNNSNDYDPIDTINVTYTYGGTYEDDGWYWWWWSYYYYFIILLMLLIIIPVTAQVARRRQLAKRAALARARQRRGQGDVVVTCEMPNNGNSFNCNGQNQQQEKQFDLPPTYDEVIINVKPPYPLTEVAAPTATGNITTVIVDEATPGATNTAAAGGNPFKDNVTVVDVASGNGANSVTVIETTAKTVVTNKSNIQ